MKNNIFLISAFSGMIVTIGAWSGAGIINGWNVPSL
jgi:hypothetical protein